MSHRFPGNWILAHMEIARLNPNTTTDDARDLQLFKEHYGENLPASAPSNVGFKWYDQSNNDNLKRPKLAEKTGRGQRRILPEPQWQDKVGTPSTSHSVSIPLIHRPLADPFANVPGVPAEPSVSKSTTNKMDWKTITLETAKRAVKAYNDGTYRGEPNPEVDRRARQTFEKGLGSTYEEILRQVEFIGKDYGGVAGQPSAINLAPKLATDIFRNRKQYEQAAYSAKPILQELPSRSTIEALYHPFVKPHNKGLNWQVWATKFWHFLNPDAFPMADSRVNKFFELYSRPNSIDMYLEVTTRFREFALSHQEWVSFLQQVDGRLAWCENKLWDKMCYGLGELKLLR